MTRAILALVVGVALGMVQNHGAQATKWRRHSGLFCQWQAGYDGSTGWDSNYGMKNISHSGALTLYCPYVDDSDSDRTTMNGLNVHMYNAGGSSSAVNVCVKYYGSTGYTCDGWTYTGGSGWNTVTPYYSGTWKSASYVSDWAFLMVSLNQGDALSGYFVTTNT